MKALVYHGPTKISWDEVPMPKIIDQSDAIIKVDITTICGTDLHILKGDTPEVKEGRILGHEAVGTVQEVGTSVSIMCKRVRIMSILSRNALWAMP